MAGLGFSLGMAEKHIHNLSQICLKASRDLADTKREQLEIRRSENDRWMTHEAELMEKMVIKYGTYFRRGFEEAVRQFAEQNFPPTNCSEGMPIESKKFTGQI